MTDAERKVVEQMVAALAYHTQQTRPIASTQAAIAAGRALLERDEQPAQGDDEDVWLRAASAFAAAVPAHLHGHAEWEERMRAAMKVLAEEQPSQGGRRTRGGEAMTDERFRELCAILPAETNWYEPMTPQLVDEIASAVAAAARREALEECEKACDKVSDERSELAVDTFSSFRQDALFAEADGANQCAAAIRALQSAITDKGAAQCPE